MGAEARDQYAIHIPGRPRSLERSDRARVLNAHAHVYKYTHAHWSTTTGPYHYDSAQEGVPHKAEQFYAVR